MNNDATLRDYYIKRITKEEKSSYYQYQIKFQKFTLEIYKENLGSTIYSLVLTNQINLLLKF